MSQVYDVLIVGCGAVGSAVARELSLFGKRIVVCEKNGDVLTEASSGNTGHLARNFYYTLERAPLEFTMTRRAATHHNQEWLSSQPNVPRRKSGLLFLARNTEEHLELQRLEDLGVANGESVRIIDRDELRKLEPDLCLDEVDSALFSHEEFVVDPFLLPLSNLYTALELGCKVLTETEVIGFEWKTDFWEIRIKSGNQESTILAKSVVNCGGNYSDDVNRMNGLIEDFRVTPGKGEYGIFECVNGSGGDVGAMVVPVPTKNFAGVYIFKSVYNHIVVGPTNVRQDSKTDRQCDAKTLEHLLTHLRKLYPNAEWRQIGSYAGLRPASPDSDDYLIKLDLERNWLTLGAIRSTGLTTSRALAEFAASKLFPEEKKNEELDQVMPFPEPQEDGRIKVGQHFFRPTHKLSQLGLFQN